MLTVMEMRADLVIAAVEIPSLMSVLNSFLKQLEQFAQVLLFQCYWNNYYGNCQIKNVAIVILDANIYLE